MLAQGCWIPSHRVYYEAHALRLPLVNVEVIRPRVGIRASDHARLSGGTSLAGVLGTNHVLA